MLSLLVTAVLAQTPATMAVPPFSFAGIDAVVGRAWEERFLSQLATPGLKLTSARDIQQVLGLERQRQLLGCDTNTSCLAELAGALGVEFVLTGSIVRSESGFVATLRAVRTKDGEAVVAMTERHRSEGALLDWLDAVAPKLGKQVLAASRPSPDTSNAAPPVENEPVKATPVATTSIAARPTPFVRWVPAIGGGLLLAGSVVSFLVSSSNWNNLASPQLDGALVLSTRRTGETAQWLGVGLAAGGVAAIVISIVWASSPAPTARLQPLVGADGRLVVLGVQGAW